MGSAIKGNWKPQSDFDVIIISGILCKNWEENVWIKVKVKKLFDSFSPFQIHLALPKEFVN